MTAIPMLSLRHVTRRFAGVAALTDLSLEVAEGEFLSLLGPSGCGKTTLLRLIAGFDKSDEGDILIAGRSQAGVAPAGRNIGLVFQNYSLWPHMTVADNVAFGLDCRGIRGIERRRRVEECLDLVQLSPMAGRLPRELSGGQQQRVALARALAYRPSLLLLDEPLSALDRKLREDLQDELRRIQRDLGVTTILVTHDQDEALALSDRIAVMNAGRIEQLATPAQVYRHPASAFVAGFVGRSNMIPGEVVRDATGPEFRTPWGLSLPAPATLDPGLYTAVVRPEHVLISKWDSAGLAGAVVEQTYSGANSVVSVQILNGPVIKALVPSTWSAAASLRVSVAVDCAIFLGSD